jgi:hypothetical protein
MKSLITALLIAASLQATATETPATINPMAVGMYQLAQGNAIQIFVTNNNDEKVTVRIKDLNGHVVFTDVVRNYDKFGRKYILSSLSKGDYTIEISNSSTTVTQSISI